MDTQDSQVRGNRLGAVASCRQLPPGPATGCQRCTSESHSQQVFSSEVLIGSNAPCAAHGTSCTNAIGSSCSSKLIMEIYGSHRVAANRTANNRSRRTERHADRPERESASRFVPLLDVDTNVSSNDCSRAKFPLVVIPPPDDLSNLNHDLYTLENEIIGPRVRRNCECALTCNSSNCMYLTEIIVILTKTLVTKEHHGSPHAKRAGERTIKSCQIIVRGGSLLPRPPSESHDVRLLCRNSNLLTEGFHPQLLSLISQT